MADYLSIARRALERPQEPGWEGPDRTQSPEIEVGTAEPKGPTEPELATANAVLGQAGVRFMELEGGTTVGIWSDLDGPEVRAALRDFGSDRLPVRHLDGAGVPVRYKVRVVHPPRASPSRSAPS